MTPLNDQQRQLVRDNLRLIGFVVGKLRHRQDVRILGDDAVGAGCVGLCHAALTWDSSRSRFSTYAVLCIRHAVWAAARRRRLPESRVEDLDVLAVAADDDSAVRREVVGLTAGAVEELPPRLRQAVQLRYWSGCTLAEIGEALGVSTQRAQHLLRRAEALLAERLSALAA